tara:strand:+ start:304 stop:519 length:216 start_codon:yes stop_codon:yes gene_type:complete
MNKLNKINMVLNFSFGNSKKYLKTIKEKFIIKRRKFINFVFVKATAYNSPFSKFVIETFPRHKIFAYSGKI